MLNPLLALNFTAGAAVPAFTVVKFSADQTVVASAAAGDSHLGVSSALAAASGERCDVYVSGVVQALAGAAITRGALLSVDASGRVIAAAAAAGANVRTIGVALQSAGAANDVIGVLLQPGSFQG